MVKITKCTEPCFAKLSTGCKILTVECEDAGSTCPFYKPKSCKDWIRVENRGEVWIVPPEEYYEMRLLRKRI